LLEEVIIYRLISFLRLLSENNKRAATIATTIAATAKRIETILPLNGVVCPTGGDVGKGVIVELGFEVG
jgi:hypothetical protein